MLKFLEYFGMPILFLVYLFFYYTSSENTKKDPSPLRRFLIPRERKVHKCFMLLDELKSAFPEAFKKSDFETDLIRCFTNPHVDRLPKDVYVWTLCAIAHKAVDEINTNAGCFNRQGLSKQGEAWVQIFKYCNQMLPMAGYQYSEDEKVWHDYTIADVEEDIKEMEAIIKRRIYELNDNY